MLPIPVLIGFIVGGILGAIAAPLLANYVLRGPTSSETESNEGHGDSRRAMVIYEALAGAVTGATGGAFVGALVMALLQWVYPE